MDSFQIVLASLVPISPNLWLVLFAIPATCVTFLKFRKDGIIKMPFTQHVLGTCLAYVFLTTYLLCACYDAYDFKEMISCSLGIGALLPFIGFILGFVFFLYFPKRYDQDDTEL